MCKKWLAKIILKLSGWTIDYKIPVEASRSVMIAAPHTTNWDAWYLIWVFSALDIPMKFTIKKEWTEHWLFGRFIRSNGGVGIDRFPKKITPNRESYVDQMAKLFDVHDRIAMVVAPEGTRRRQHRWKLGFYYTAKLANVPITLGYLDFKHKRAGIGGPIYLTDDMEADMRKIMAFYSQIHPKFPENFALDDRYYP